MMSDRFSCPAMPYHVHDKIIFVVMMLVMCLPTCFSTVGCETSCCNCFPGCIAA